MTPELTYLSLVTLLTAVLPALPRAAGPDLIDTKYHKPCLHP